MSAIIIPGERKTLPLRIEKVKRSAKCGGVRAVRLVALWKGDIVTFEAPERGNFYEAALEVFKAYSRRTGAKIGDVTKGLPGFEVTGRRRRIA